MAMANPGHSGRPTRSMSELAERLRRESRRLTGPRQAILEVLRQHRRPLSNKEILELLPGDCDLATVYRAMHLLRRLGLVQRYDLGDGVARHELLAPDDDGHHHHLVCRRCARVVELEDCGLAAFEESLVARSGFTQVTHRLEFFGVCPDCQRAG
ncbi:MAG: transcriptional repressor [Verrucomicrobia bacterium]|nr:MAG: transcriptional repressor [Verrucomicrobiota bacterium]